jgi:hypothetical protein
VPVSVSLSAPFSNACVSVVLTLDTSGAQRELVIEPSTVSTTGFGAISNSSAQGFWYMAVGY